MLKSYLLLGATGASVVVQACALPSDPSTSTSDEQDLSTSVAKLRALGAKPCTQADKKGFLCLDLEVPLDHFGAADGKKIKIGFAVHAAPAATRKGIFINATGGPGYSGLDSPDDYKSTDERITKMFDLVYFDLRGVGRSGNLECKAAAKAYYAGGLRSESKAEDDVLAARSKTFARDCVQEMGIPTNDVQYYNTTQAIEDIEDFRSLMGEEKVTLYGLSYGTQFMQTYARVHAEHVRAMVIDGTVDLTLNHIDYMKNLNAGIDKIFARVAATCAKDPACAAPFARASGATAEARFLAAYDAVAARLDAKTATVAFTKKSGRVEQRTYTRKDLDTTTFNAVGAPDTRRDLPSALAAAFVHDDFRPLLDVSYAAAGIDPETAGPTGTAGADDGMSDAIYYAVTCNDYGLESPVESTRVKQYLAAGAELRAENARILSPYYGDLPCMFWPTQKVAKVERALAIPTVPVIVVDATGDGATPYDMGESVFRGLGNGYLISIDGGKHVMYGEGNACADKPINELIVSLTPPSARETHCAGVFMSKPTHP